MKKYWNYMKVGLKAWVALTVAQIVVVIPAAILLTLFSLDIMSFSYKWLIFALIVGLLLQWTVSGYFGRKLWGWK